MNDVMKKRVVGAIVLVIIGVLLPLLLARCLHGGESGDTASMRVYEVTPDGEARPAGGDAQDTNPDSNKPVADKGKSKQIASGSKIDDSSGARAARESAARKPEPQAVSPAADDNLTSSDSESFDTPPVHGRTADDASAERAASESAALKSATPESESQPDTQPSSGGNAANSSRSLRRTHSSGGWVVQVASFGDEDNAERMARELGNDYDAFYRAGSVNGKTWYRVRIGPFDSESQAQSTATKLRQQGRSTLVQRGE